MTIKHVVIISFLSLFSMEGLSQEWEHLSPIKSTDRLKSSFVLNDSTAYMGGWFGRLVKTTNTGVSWSQVDDVTGYPINGGIWGIHFPSESVGFIPDDAGRIYKTVDAAASWTQIYNSTSSNFYDAYFFNPDTGFVGGEFGELLKTVNGGDTWETIETGVTTRLYDFAFLNDSIGFIALRSGDILATTDSGNTWLSLGLDNLNDLYHIEFANESLGIAVGLNGTILRSDDSGETWEEIESGVMDRLTSVVFIDESIVLITGDYGLILRSEDGGESFTELSALSVYNLWNLLLFPNGLCYALGDRIVLESYDLGANWGFRFDGIPQAQLMRMVYTDSNTFHAAGRATSGGNSRSAIIKSTDNGRVWHTNYESMSQFGDVTDLSFIDEDHGFASAYNSIRTTTNGGEGNWNYLNEDGYFTAIHFFDSDTGLVGNTLDGIFLTTDGGNNWEQVDACGDVNHFFFLDRDTGYAATDGGSIRKTFDGGETWTALDVGVFSSLQSVFFVNDSTGYAVGDNGAGVKTEDYGVSWSSVSVNQFARDVYCPDPNNADSVYVLLASGEIQKSIDGGDNWTIALPNMNNQEMWDFEFIGPYIYVCGNFGDILRSRIIPCELLTFEVDTSVCNVYIAPDGSEITDSGDYSFQVAGEEGCFAYYNVSLTVNSNSTSSIIETHCESYIAPDGQVYFESGIYSAVIPTISGCDSLISIDLTIININTNVIDASPTLLAEEEGLQYQWLNCNNAYSEIENETESSFTALENGSYAVQISDNQCIDTSECVLVSNTFMHELNAFNEINNYPNPVEDKLYISISDTKIQAVLSIYSSTGKKVYSSQIKNTPFQTIEFNFPPGMYILELKRGEAQGLRKKIMKR